MEYLHTELHTVHRDLKHHNILMGLQSPDPMNDEESQPTIKITDFTTAMLLPHDPNDPEKEAQHKVSSQDGSLAFNAPE